MSRGAKLLEAARENPKGLRFTELCSLAEYLGWEFMRQNGSHRVYQKEGQPRPMVFQEGRNGTAVPYQVRQLLATTEPVLRVSK